MRAAWCANEPPELSRAYRRRPVEQLIPGVVLAPAVVSLRAQPWRDATGSHVWYSLRNLVCMKLSLLFTYVPGRLLGRPAFLEPEGVCRLGCGERRQWWCPMPRRRQRRRGGGSLRGGCGLGCGLRGGCGRQDTGRVDDWCEYTVGCFMAGLLGYDLVCSLQAREGEEL